MYRAVDKPGCTVDFHLTARRDHAAARRLFERAIDLHDVPEKITIDKSGASKAAVLSIKAEAGLSIELRKLKYLNNLVEQDHTHTVNQAHGIEPSPTSSRYQCVCAVAAAGCTPKNPG